MPTDLAAATRPSRGRAALPWAASVAVLGGTAAAIALTGGFGTTAPAFLGSESAVGEQISTRLWDVSVEGAEMSSEDGKVLVSINATNRQHDSALGLTTNMLVVLLPGGGAMWRSYCNPVDRSSFGPDLATHAVCEFSYDQNDVGPPEASEAMDIRVVVTDQSMTDALLHVPTPEAGEPVGWVPLLATAVVEEP